MLEIQRMVLGDTKLEKYQIEIPKTAFAGHTIYTIDDTCTGENILKKIEQIQDSEEVAINKVVLLSRNRFQLIYENESNTRDTITKAMD